MLNIDVNLKKFIHSEKIMFGILLNVFVKMENIVDDSTIIFNEVVKSYDEEIKIIPTNFNEKKVTCKTQSFYTLLALLSITITLLIAVSIYCHRVSSKKFITISQYKKLKQFCFVSIN